MVIVPLIFSVVGVGYPLQYASNPRITVTYEQAVKRADDRLFPKGRTGSSRDQPLVWLKPNQTFVRRELFSTRTADRFSYRPDVAIGFGDGLFGATAVHSSWLGGPRVRHVRLNLFGFIPLGRVRVNGGR